MSETFIVADTHFGHAGVCRFLRDDGSPLRPWDDVREMDEALVERWNAVVSPKDKVYHLGDVAMSQRHVGTVGRLNGRKVLIKGNHDRCPIWVYMNYFSDVRSYLALDRLLFSHVPVHPGSLGRYSQNVHGHLHYRVVLTQDGTEDPRYRCVSVEHTEYAPISFNVLRMGVDNLGNI